MKVIVAEHSGICFGVKRALDTVYSESKKCETLCTLGPLIHNPQVVESLRKEGVGVADKVADAKGAIVMPSHGVAREVIDEALSLGLKVIDATCPFVSNVHEKVRRLARSGYEVVIVGDSGHSEVKAIKSAAGDNAVVLESAEEASKGDWNGKKVGIVSQTTQTPACFAAVVAVIAAQASETLAYNTICYATHRRQSAARDLAPKVDAVVVVGGRNSANTNRLAEICAETGVPTYHIEKAEELDPAKLAGAKVVGLTAGASTPDWIINEVKTALESM